MAVQRAAIIFDNTVRPDTTGGYCKKALESLVQVEHFLPTELDQLEGTDFDLYLSIDDGLGYRLPDVHPLAWWAIDTHLDMSRCLARARDADFVFAAQRDGVERFQQAGIESATWLPLACSPDVHCKHDVPKQWDVCFVGHLFPGPRIELLQLIQKHFPRSFVGQQFFTEMVRTFSESRIVFNRSIVNDVNMRVFEALASGSLLLTNDLSSNGQDELFQDGKHLVTYRDPQELLEKIRFCLTNEEAREKIAAAGRKEAITKHTYKNRMETILAKVAGEQSAATVPDKPIFARPVNEPSPPAKLSPKAAKPSASGAPGIPELELLQLVPLEVRQVLILDNGFGQLAQALKQRQPVEVIGVVSSEAKAGVARKYLDRVIVGNVADPQPELAGGTLDAIVLSDLGQLREPVEWLQRARKWLKPDGRLVASVANVRHHSVVAALLEGNWDGSTDLSGFKPLRHFTRKEVDKVLNDGGFATRQIRAVPGSGYQDWQEQGRPGNVKTGAIRIGDMDPEEAEEFYVSHYLVDAVPVHSAQQEATKPLVASPKSAANPSARLRILYLGNFAALWTDETAIAFTLLHQGHSVTKRQENLMPSASAVLQELNSCKYDCLLFSKGRIGARTPQEMLDPSGQVIAEVIRNSKVPCYTWYFDRALNYDLSPSREAWMRKVAPLCRVAFVTEEALARTTWARWHLLRMGIASSQVQEYYVPESEKQDVGFIGQVYGDRTKELDVVAEEFKIHLITNTFGSALSAAMQAHKIILGPYYPSTPGYWSNRIYLVLGHGGFFLAPEVEGMREEGFVPGVHYAALGKNPVADVRYWLKRPEERLKIARAGQELVLSRFTYEHRVRELCQVIQETLA